MPTAFLKLKIEGAPNAPARRPWLAWTAASLAAITVIKFLAFEYIGPAVPFLLYFAAILVAAWYGGWRGGLLATALSAALGMYFFLPPYGSFAIADLARGVQIGVFLVEGVAITAVTARLRTERTHAGALVRETQTSLAKLEGVLRGVVDGITVQNARGQLVYSNEAAAKLCGFPSAAALVAAPVPEILGRFELLTPEGAPFPPDQLPGRLALAGQPAPERLIGFRVRATGEERWALVRANAVTMPGSDEPFAINVFQDVTDARRKEEALRVSQEWLSTTLRSIGDAVITTDGKGKVTFMNPVAEHLTGWPAAEAQGRALSDVFHILHEETRAPVESPVDRVLREGQVVGLANHTVLVGRHGTERAIDDSAAPIRSTKGDLAGTVLVFRDVSRKRREEQQRAFIGRATAELASSLDYRRTLSTVAHLAVPTIADWCAVDMVEDGKLERLAVAHVDPAKIQFVFEIERRYPRDQGSGAYEVVRTGSAQFIPEIPDDLLVARARDPEHLRLIRALHLRSYIAVPLTADERVIGVLTLAMAESDRRYGPEDLDLARALADRAALAVNHARLFQSATGARLEAERADRAKDEFLAMLGHELRNPLAPILTTLQLMRLRAPEVLERERSVLERQVKHLVTLVDDLLDVSRITRGKIELHKEPVDLADTLAKALELTEPLIEERRQRVVTAVPRALWVDGDPVRLSQVLTNLLQNAAKYTEPGGNIEVTGRREGDLVVLSVRDDGVGIDPELLPRIFNLFVQGRQSLDRAKGGLGLGLAIVRSVVELHGGRVEAKSDGPGRGSEFRVVLPARNAPVIATTPKADPAPTLRSTASVLVVDDNADALELLGEALQLVGYRTHTAADPAAALAVAARVNPDIALLDIGLPVMDGYELARRLRELPGLDGLKLVAITGYGQAADKERARDAGFHEHLVKPISVDEVERVVERLLAR